MNNKTQNLHYFSKSTCWLLLQLELLYSNRHPTQHYMLQGTPYDKYISQGYLYKIDIAYIANVYNIYHIFTSNNHTRKYGQKLSNFTCFLDLNIGAYQ